jgi:hypothetical protein
MIMPATDFLLIGVQTLLPQTPYPQVYLPDKLSLATWLIEGEYEQVSIP